MTDYNFEPDQLVLVRMHHTEEWRLHHYSHESTDMYICGSVAWRFCIPYTPETAHLLGTTQTYEPQKEYEFGDKVEVCRGRNGVWCKGIFVKNKCCTSQPFVVAVQGYDDTMCVNSNEIRPLTT